MHLLGHCCRLISLELLPKIGADVFCIRSSTKPASTRSFSETSSESTTCAIRSSVRRCIPISQWCPPANTHGSRIQMRFRRLRRWLRHQLTRTHQILHRRHDRASRLHARSLLPPPYRPKCVPLDPSLDPITNIDHRDTPLSQSIPALDSIRAAGKTKYIGLSECSAETLRKANSSTYTPNKTQLISMV